MCPEQDIKRLSGRYRALPEGFVTEASASTSEGFGTLPKLGKLRNLMGYAALFTGATSEKAEECGLKSRLNAGGIWLRR